MVSSKALSSASPCLLLLATALVLPLWARAFNLERMCETRCYYGRGGNLCNCNAFHFAGKRSGDQQQEELDTQEQQQKAMQQSAADSLLDLALYDQKFAQPHHGSPALGGVSSSAVGGRAAGSSVGAKDGGGDDKAGVIVEEFFGVEGREDSVRRLAALLKAAVNDRLINSMGKSRRERQSSVPYGVADAMF